MELREQVYSLLVVSAAEKFNRSLSELLPENIYFPVKTVADVGSAKRELLERGYDLVIINTPLPDDFGTRLAVDICQGSSTGVLLFVKAEHYPDVNAKVMPYGVLTLSKPTSAQMILQTLVLLCGTRERLKFMEKKAATLEDKMEEIRIVNRAKWLLISELKMSEEDAHRYIEKQAMDRCITRRAMAESIIRTYKQ